MAEKKQQTSNSSDQDAIAPAQVSLNAQPDSARSQSQQASVWRQHRLAIAGLTISLSILLAVVFLLPGVVAPVETPKQAAIDAGAPMESPPAAAASGPTESPWQDAQFAKARREAQTMLEKLLEKQEQLEDIRVELWAGEDYALAQHTAETADQHYRRQEFSEAQQHYQASLEQFNQLLQRSESVFESALAAGQQAIVDGETDLAREQLELAAHIKPNNSQVELGLQRAAVLEDLLAEIDAGEELERNSQLEAARQRYQAALELDEQSQLAADHLRAVDQAIADRDFGKHMSMGFAAMSDNRHQQAIDAFQRALDIKPQAADARDALAQARNQSTQTTLQTLLNAAKQQERKEQWQAAVDSYEQALKIDANLVEARVGAIRAGTRADVDEKLQAILASPQRLTTPAVHREYQAFHRETLNIKNPGPRLTRQLEELEEALQLAVQPVTVQFISDDATQVTVYKVGELGTFSETRLTLKPGTYTVVGTRKGYRDVRQEFTVSAADDNRSPIEVQCVEKISQG